MLKLPLVDRAKFFVERQFVKGAGFQLLIVAAVIGLISLVGGMAVHTATSSESLLDSVWWAFLRLTDPGYLGDDEGTWRRIVSTTLTVSGYVVFLGALVAIMTQWLIARMREFERGLTPVTLKQHVVIVGWTTRTLPLLRELVGSPRSRDQFRESFGIRSLEAVVLSDDVSPAQAQALRVDSGLGRLARRVILRDGSPLEEEAIHRAGCLNAAVVIMPTDFSRSSSSVDADVKTIRSLLSIDARAELSGQKAPLVIAELQDMRRVEVARNAYRGPLELIPSDDAICRLLAQNVLHPGLSVFFREVLTVQEGVEIVLRPAGKLAGATLKVVASQCPRVIVLGVIREVDGRRRAMLNLPTSEVVQDNDRLVMLAHKLGDTVPVTSQARQLPPVERHRHKPRLHRDRRRHTLLVLGWNSRMPDLLHELASYGQHQFEITMISTVDIDHRCREIDQFSPQAARVPVEHVQADFLLAGMLERHDLEHFSSILLLPSDRLDSEEAADARSIVGHRLVENLLAGGNLRTQVILELSDAANEGLVRVTGAETVISPLILSHLLARVALQPDSRLIFDELFTAGGAEIEFCDPAHFALKGTRSFQSMESAVAAYGDTLLGVLLDGEAPHGGLQLNPPRDRQFNLDQVKGLCLMTTIQAR